MYNIRICIQSIYLRLLSLKKRTRAFACRSIGSNNIWSTWSEQHIYINYIHYGETQPHQIYTLNAYSDTIHIFIMWGDNRLCSFTNQGELHIDVLGKLTKSARWLCSGRPQSRPPNDSARHTRIYFFLKGTSKIMQPTSSAVNWGTSVSGHLWWSDFKFCLLLSFHYAKSSCHPKFLFWWLHTSYFCNGCCQKFTPTTSKSFCIHTSPVVSLRQCYHSSPHICEWDVLGEGCIFQRVSNSDEYVILIDPTIK